MVDRSCKGVGSNRGCYKMFHINSCYSWRLYPHQQDTGGFFIAVLEKKSVLPWTPGYRPHPKLLPWEITKKEKKVRLVSLLYQNSLVQNL